MSEPKEEKPEEFKTQDELPTDDLKQQIETHTHTGAGTSQVNSDNVIRNWKSACRVYLAASTQNINSLVITKVAYETKDYDLSNEFDTTNNQFVANKDGYYQIDASAELQLSVASDIRIHLYKNGAAYEYVKTRRGDSGGSQSMNISTMIKLVAGDYIDIRADHATEQTDTINGGTTKTWLNIYKIY